MLYLDFTQPIGADSFQPQNEFEIDIQAFLSEWNNDSLTMKAQTSGSTGQPKEIVLTKENMRKSAQMTAKYLQLKQGDTALLVMPISYIAGKLMLVRALEIGLKLICMPPTSSISLPTINDELGIALSSIDFVALTPMQVEKSIDFAATIQTLIIGGAPLSPTVKEKLFSFNNAVYETYAMTETITHIAFKQIPNQRFPLVSGYFEAFDEVNISTDERGCLVIDTPYSSDPVVTNDLVEMKGERSFIWLGRVDNVINSGGIKLFPEQIEEKLKTIIEAPFFVTAIADQRLGQKLVLVIEDSPKHIDLSEADLTQFQRPKEIVFLPVFPRTESGKIQRSKIKLT